MPHVIGHNLKDAFNRNKRGTPISSELPSNLFQGLGPTAGRPELPIIGPKTTLPGAIPLAEEPSQASRISGIFKTGTRALRSVGETLLEPRESLGDPRTGKFLSQLGAAINPRSQVSQALGALGTSLAEGRSEEAFRRRLAAGEKPGEIFGGLTGALTPEVRAGAIEEAFRGREVAAGEAAAARRGEVKPFTANFQLNADGTEAPPGVVNKFSVDPTTKKLTFIGPVKTAEEELEKGLVGSEFNAIDDILTREFLDIATAEIEREFEGSEEQLREALKVLDVSEFTGRPSTEQVFSALSPEQRRQFRSRRAILERGLRSGRLLGEMAPELAIDTIEEFEALNVGDIFVKDGVLRRKIDDDNSEVVE